MTVNWRIISILWTVCLFRIPPKVSWWKMIKMLWRSVHKRCFCHRKISTVLQYRKIPKISPWAYIFQRPFLRGLFLEGLKFGGAYLRREICVSKSIGLACSGKEIYHFCFVLLCIRGQIPSTSLPGGLYSEGRFNGGFFALEILGGLYLEGFIHGGAYFGNFTVSWCCYSHRKIG